MNERDDFLTARRTPTGALDMEYYTELARRERRIAIRGWLRTFAQAWRHAVRSLRAAAMRMTNRVLSREHPTSGARAGLNSGVMLQGLQPPRQLARQQASDGGRAARTA